LSADQELVNYLMYIIFKTLLLRKLFNELKLYSSKVKGILL